MIQKKKTVAKHFSRLIGTAYLIISKDMTKG